MFSKNSKLSLLFISGLILILLLLFLLLNRGTEPQVAKNQAALTNTYWKLIELGDQAIVTTGDQREMKITLREENKVTGFAGCNSFFGSYTFDESSIKFSEIAASRMFCSETMELEDLFLKSLAETTVYNITGRVLTLSDDEGKPRVILKAVYLK